MILLGNLKPNILNEGAYMNFSCYDKLTREQKQEIIEGIENYIQKQQKILTEKLKIMIYLLKSLQLYLY